MPFALLPMVLLLSAPLLLWPPSVQGCDDSLIAIFQATNPDERFTGQVHALIVNVKSLSDLIAKGDYQGARNQLYALMDLWMAFNNGYLMQPPFPVEDMSIWRQQSAHIANRIGSIHAKFKANAFDRVHPDLDFLVTDLTSLYAQKSAQSHLFQALIKLDILAASLNPALGGTSGLASSAVEFAQLLNDWKDLDPDTEHRQRIAALQSQSMVLARTPSSEVLRRNDLCQAIRSEYESLKRLFVLPIAR